MVSCQNTRVWRNIVCCLINRSSQQISGYLASRLKPLMIPWTPTKKKTEEASKKRMPLPDDIEEEYDTSDACKRWNSSNNST